MEHNNPVAARIATLVYSNPNSRITTSNRVTVLQDAKTTYPALIKAINQAKSSVHLHYYIWNGDTFGTRLLTILAQKVREGVEVRILYDPVGSFSGLGCPRGEMYIWFSTTMPPTRRLTSRPGWQSTPASSSTSRLPVPHG